MGNAFPPPGGGVALPVSIANGGTGQTTAAAALAALISNQQVSAFRFQATGQTGAAASVHYAGATAGGPPQSGSWTTGDVVPDTTGNLWVCTAGGTPGTWAGMASAGMLAAPNVYAPAAQTALAVAATTLAAVDSGVVCTPAFTVPASGSVLVRCSAVLQASAGGAIMNVGLAPVGTTTLVAGSSLVTMEINATTARTPVPMDFIVSGLAPGSAQQWDLVAACTTADTVSFMALASQTVGQAAGNIGQPVIVSVQGL